MQLIADTHVHIYPFYKVEKALETTLAQLSRSAPSKWSTHAGNGTVKIACLTERHDCDIYNELKTSPSDAVTAVFDIEPLEGALRIRHREGRGEFYLLPGQQIITSENIEVLSLSASQRVEEGRSARETVQDVLDCGGLPVVAWAPGKWFGSRGQVVNELLDQFTPAQLALGDTTLRPLGWLLPIIMRKARRRGFKILYGSDPLPFKGEEKLPGCYRTILQSSAGNDLDPEQAAGDPASLIQNLLSQPWHIRSAGRRGTLYQVAVRLFKNHRTPGPSRQGATQS